MAAALLALALAAQAGDPCLATDEQGRTFALCFDPGNRIELSAGGAAGDREPDLGGALELGAAVRWRRDLRSRTGALEWMLDQTFGEARALFAAGDPDPIAASALAWRGTFLRHRGSPFVLVPGPRPLRLPFPFDVGLRVEVGGASWEAARRHDVTLSPIRSALLLDIAGHGVLRRLAFGPEVSWGVRVLEHAQTVHDIVPFTAGVLDVRAESRDGLHALSLTFRGGSRIAVPGGSAGFVEGTLALERVVLAVNDRPVALYASATARGGAAGRGFESSFGLRAALAR
ncbi:MAG TPA: hypothetical protein VF912_07540 [Anaeromyxobacter sp.]